MDPIVETVISLVTPYVAFVAAEQAHASGVTAVVVASVVGGALPHRTSATTRLHLQAVYQTTVFVLESVVFGLIGLELPGLLRDEHEGWIAAAIAIAASMLVVRLAWVFPLATLRGWRGLGGDRGSWAVTAVVSWAGARGVVPLAAALSIPLVDDSGAPLPLRNLILVLAIGVIVISLVVQGFTLAPLVRRMGLVAPERRDEIARAWQRLRETALSYLDERATTVDPRMIEQARRSVIAGAAMATADSGEPGHAYRQLRRDVLTRQDAELRRMYRAGELTEHARRSLQRQLDLEAERFSGPA